MSHSHVAPQIFTDSMAYEQPVSAAAGGGVSGMTWSGWAAGAALLALLVLVVRATENYLDKLLSKRRRRSVLRPECPSPNTATIQQQNEDISSESRDLPPRYSECGHPGCPGRGGKGDNKTYHNREESPPPYSVYLVETSNKHISTAHIHTSQGKEHQPRHDRPSTRLDNLIETRDRVDVEDSYEDDNTNIELFKNKHIVERIVNDNTNENVAAMVNDVEEIVIGTEMVTDVNRERVIIV